jgi:Ca2+-binding EF-hand superfamily protein
MSEPLIIGHNGTEALKDFVSVFEPFEAKTDEASKLRKDAFRNADSNGSGYCSLAEMEVFIQAALRDRYEGGKDSELFDRFRPSYLHAFKSAKVVVNSDGSVLGGMKTATADDYVSFAEFRLFTIFLRIYASMFSIFITVDGGGEGRSKDDDARISLDEFLASYQEAKAHGFEAFKDVDSEEDAKELFETIDTNGGGFVLFSELAEYVKKMEIEKGTKVGLLLSTKVTPKPKVQTPAKTVTSTPDKSTNGTAVRTAAPKSATKNPKFALVMPQKISEAYIPAKNCSKELKMFIKSFQPFAEKADTSKNLRKVAFRSCDMNGSGKASLAEIDGFVLDTLKKDYGPEEGDRVYDTFRPSFIRAFSNANDLIDGDDDYISFAEFRILNAYLCVYAGMLDAFSKVDGGGAGISKDDDRRVSKEEWMNGYSSLSQTGFIGLNSLTNESAAEQAFSDMDEDGKGMVLFAEFCSYVQKAEEKKGTSLGKLLTTSALTKTTPKK